MTQPTFRPHRRTLLAAAAALPLARPAYAQEGFPNRPLRLVVGTADPIAGQAMADRYRQVVPRADVVELAGVGHYPQIEAPGLVLGAYLEFRDRHT